MQAEDAPKPVRQSRDNGAKGEALGCNVYGEIDQNPRGVSVFALWREDWRTHETIFSHGFITLFLHRLGNWRMGLPRLLRVPFTLFYRFFYALSLFVVKIEVGTITKIGRRVRIWHNGGSVLGAMYIGDDVQIRHNVTMGLAKHGAALTTLPIIEDRVVIGAGACVLGPVTVGHDSVLGANTVVTRDIPPYSLVVGIPGTVIRTLDPSEVQTSVNVRDVSTRKAA